MFSQSFNRGMKCIVKYNEKMVIDETLYDIRDNSTENKQHCYTSCANTILKMMITVIVMPVYSVRH